jgi:sarcosine oxidase
MQGRLAAHLDRMLPGSGAPVRAVRCQYTLTPDRDFVLAPVPGHESVVVGLGAAHGFKFAPTFGRLLADLAVDGGTTVDLTPFRLDRPALTDPGYSAHWLV